MTLRTYIIRRLILIIPTFFFISIVIFTLIHLAPGDPIYAMIGRHPVSAEVMERLRADLGLDQPIPVQYIKWVSKLVQGDLGFSYVSYRPVITMIGEKLTRTLELMLIAEVVSILIAVSVGVIAAVKHYSLTDAACSLGALIGYSAPNFWVALLAILVFAVWLKLLPISGTTSFIEFASPIEALLDHLRHLVLPTSILVLTWTAYLFRMVRSSMLEVLRQD